MLRYYRSEDAMTVIGSDTLENSENEFRSRYTVTLTIFANDRTLIGFDTTWSSLGLLGDAPKLLPQYFLQMPLTMIIEKLKMNHQFSHGIPISPNPDDRNSDVRLALTKTHPLVSNQITDDMVRWMIIKSFGRINQYRTEILGIYHRKWKESEFRSTSGSTQGFRSLFQTRVGSLCGQV